jgi:hypothetical protein
MTKQQIYTELGLEKLKISISNEQKKGNPRWFRIYLDGKKIVPKTTDTNAFDRCRQAITDSTKLVKVVVYYSASGLRQEQHSFVLPCSEHRVAILHLKDALEKNFFLSAQIIEERRERTAERSLFEQKIAALEQSLEKEKSTRHSVCTFNINLHKPDNSLAELLKMFNGIFSPKQA